MEGEAVYKVGDAVIANASNFEPWPAKIKKVYQD